MEYLNYTTSLLYVFVTDICEFTLQVHSVKIHDDIVSQSIRTRMRL